MSESMMPSSLPSLCTVLTMPVVTVFCRAKGLPMATTNSPGLRSAERPRDRTGSFFCSAEAHRRNRQKKTPQKWTISRRRRRRVWSLQSYSTLGGVFGRWVWEHTHISVPVWVTGLMFMTVFPPVLWTSSRDLWELGRAECEEDVGSGVMV